jgi:hypothetical protein
MAMKYEPKNPRPNWSAEGINGLLAKMNYQPTWGGVPSAWRQPNTRDLKGVDVAFLV